MTSVAYARCSTEEQSLEGLSLRTQRDTLAAWGKLHNCALEHNQDVASGSTLARQGIQNIIERIERGEVSRLVVTRLDRLSRSLLDTCSLIQLCQEHDVALVSVQESLDTSTPSGRFVTHLLGAVSEHERELISQRTRDALASKRRRGEWTGKPPYGFEIAADGCLREVPEQIETVRKVKRARRDGRSIRQIAARFDLSIGLVHKLITTDLRSLKAHAVRACA